MSITADTSVIGGIAAKFRTCPATGLQVDLAAERLIKANAVAAIVFLAIGGLFGLLVALTRWQAVHLLSADLFYYKKRVSEALEGRDQLERNLSHSMPRIVTSDFPALAAAQANTQIEFDRTYRTIVTEEEYQGKNLAFIAGINIDISPQPGQLFPLTKFVPWAAYIQTPYGETF